MQKFTVFSILLSIAVILAIGDMIFHDYLNGASSSKASIDVEELLPVEEDNSAADAPIEGEAQTETGWRFSGPF